MRGRGAGGARRAVVVLLGLLATTVGGGLAALADLGPSLAASSPPAATLAVVRPPAAAGAATPPRKRPPVRRPGLLAREVTTIDGLSTLVVSGERGQNSRVLAPTYDVTHSPAVSSRGAGIVVPVALGHGLGRYGLALVRLDGAVRILTRPAVADLDPNWAPDGKQVVAVRHDAGLGTANCCRLIRVSTRGRVSTVPGPSGQLHTPTFSPDALRIAYTDDAGLRVVPSSGGRSRTLLARSGLRQPAWSPDGKTVVVVQRLAPGRAQLLSIPAGGGPARVLGHWPDAVESPQWDPDGRGLLALAYRGDGDLGRISVSLVHVGTRGRITVVATLPARTHSLGRGAGVALAPPPTPPTASTAPTPTAAASPSPSPAPSSTVVPPSPTPSPTPSVLPTSSLTP